MEWDADLKITEKEPSHIDPDAKAVYKIEIKGGLEPFYLLFPSRECIGIRDSLRDFRLPLKHWLMEWDLYSQGVIDQLYDEIPELEPIQDDK